MKSAWHLCLQVVFFVSGLFLLAPENLRAQEILAVEPSGVLNWEDIVRFEALAPEQAEQHRYVPPPLPGPAPREIAISVADRFAPTEFQSYPSTGALLHSKVPSDATVVRLESIINFEALPDNNTAIPPDTHGAAGPSHLMTMLNTQVRIQDKTGANLSTVSLSSFWTGGTGLSGDTFDPKVVYDAIHGRWIATCDANSTSDSSKVFFAISSTNDPTGAWSFYSLDADAADTTWADYPGFGVNATWIAIANNMFTVSGSPSFAGVKMWVIDKASALVPGGPITLNVFPTGFDMSGGVDGNTLQPCVTFGSEQTLYIVDNSGYSSGGIFLLRMSRITGTGSAPAWSVVPGSSFAGTGLFAVTNNFNFTQIRASQLGSDSLIETNTPRILNSVFRNARIWCTHSGGLPIAPSSSNRTAVFWYQLNPAAMPLPIAQSGVLDGGVGVHHYFPSITANSASDACIGFSRSDQTRYVEGVYTGRLAADIAGTMRPIAVFKAGLDSYEKKFSGSRIRWGDYSATVVDPSNDMTFWTIQEYAAQDVGPNPNDDRWGTWWGRVDVITNVAEDVRPMVTVLHQNYPNPFNPATTIRFSLSRQGLVTLRIYNILGENVATLVNGETYAGEHRMEWDAGNFPSGSYIARLETNGAVESRKLILLK